MNLIDNLMPSNFNEEDFEKKKSKNKLYEEELQTWRVNDKVYAKIYFERIYVDSSFSNSSFSSSSIIKADYKSIICKSKDYNLFRRKADTSYGYIIEFYIDRDFEFNSVWENIYTTI